MNQSLKMGQQVIPGSQTPSEVLTFSPQASGYVRQTVTLSAWMTPNSTVKMQWFSGDSTGADVPFVIPCVTDNEGFFNCDFKVPALFFGNHQVIATDSQDVQVSGSFSVEPSITLSPATGPAASSVTISGSGWALNDGIYLWFDD